MVRNNIKGFGEVLEKHGEKYDVGFLEKENILGYGNYFMMDSSKFNYFQINGIVQPNHESLNDAGGYVWSNIFTPPVEYLETILGDNFNHGKGAISDPFKFRRNTYLLNSNIYKFLADDETVEDLIKFDSLKGRKKLIELIKTQYSPDLLSIKGILMHDGVTYGLFDKSHQGLKELNLIRSHFSKESNFNHLYGELYDFFYDIAYDLAESDDFD